MGERRHPNLDDIRDAARIIDGAVLRTPFLPAPKLDELTGARIGVKYENMQVTNAFKIILGDPKVEGILVNIFGGIMDCNVIAEGIVAACQEVSLDLPLVVRLEGNNVAAGKKTLAESGVALITGDDLADAAEKVVKAIAA